MKLVVDVPDSLLAWAKRAWPNVKEILTLAIIFFFTLQIYKNVKLLLGW